MTHQSRLLCAAAVCAISLAAHPSFAPDTGGGGGKASSKEKSKDSTDEPTPAERVQDAVAANPTGPALKAADDGGPAGDADQGDGAPFTDLTAANAEIVALREELAKVKASGENEAATLRAENRRVTEAHEELRARMVAGNLTTTQRDQAEDALGDDFDPEDVEADLVEVRVKTPMQINPNPDDWRYSDRGPPLAPFSLVRGLNKVPRWVADHWLVKGNLEDEHG